MGVLGITTQNVLSFLSEGTSRQLIQPQVAAEVFYKLQNQEEHTKVVDMRLFFPFLFCFFLEYECKIILSGLREMEEIQGKYPEYGNSGSGFLSILAHYVSDYHWERASFSLQDLEAIIRSFRSSGHSRYLQLTDIEVVRDIISRKFGESRGRDTVVRVEEVLPDILKELQIVITHRKLAEEKKLNAKSLKVTRIRVELVSFLGNLKPEKFKDMFFEATAPFSITITFSNLLSVLQSVLSKCLPNFSPDHVLTLAKNLQADPEVQKVGTIEPKQFKLDEGLPDIVLRHLYESSRRILQEFFVAMERSGSLTAIASYPYQQEVKEVVEKAPEGLLYQLKGNRKLKRLLGEDVRRLTLLSIARLVKHI